MKTFIISDTHFSHYNIIKFNGRPFASVIDMNESIIKNWNNNISSNDIVYHLGDVGFGNSKIINDILYRLNGEIHLIVGNHEKTVLSNKQSCQRFSSIKDYYQFKYRSENGKEYFFVMSHYPFLTWNRSHYGSISLHGHCHSKENSRDIKRFDVGVDANNFTPVNIEYIIDFFKNTQSVKHH